MLCISNSGIKLDKKNARKRNMSDAKDWTLKKATKNESQDSLPLNGAEWSPTKTTTECAMKSVMKCMVKASALNSVNNAKIILNDAKKNSEGWRCTTEMLEQRRIEYEAKPFIKCARTRNPKTKIEKQKKWWLQRSDKTSVENYSSWERQFIARCK